MSDVIQLLPDSVANQIAAGEVIQRPSSVIKELVENSVDAGAKSIQVIVHDAGRTLIQVIDDGQGMSETDARLAFERHATSKIRKADYLFDLHTMGFRGEALPSIAAVSQVELITRKQEEDFGTHLVLQGSRVAKQEPIASPVGSNFRVENIFFNVPARRKFLKTNATEMSNILSAFERIVLVYPNIAFSLFSNGQELLNMKPGSLRQRIVDVFGKKINQDLLPVEVDTTLCKIHGFVGKPESARKKGAQTFFFVNGRFMKHAYFHKAISNAFERLVPQGMNVPYFVYFEVPPTDIDVNIHPTKTEIKFENEQSIWQILNAAVKDAIGRFCEVPAIDFDTEGKPDIPVFNPLRDSIELPQAIINPEYNPFDKATGSGNGGGGSIRSSKGFRPEVDPEWKQLYDDTLFSDQRQPSLFSDATDLPLFSNPTEPSTIDELVPSRTNESLIADKSPAHYQYKGRYIMTAVRSGLMIIDQYRADVRIRYERFMKQFTEHPGNSQRLLFPEVVSFSPSESALLDLVLPELSSLGFDISSLGGGSYAVAGVPAGLEGIQPTILVQEVVADAADQQNSSIEQIHSALALGLARHAAIPHGQVLSNEEMENLVNQLFMCSNVNYTPDGQTVLTILAQSEIEHLLN